MLYALYGSVPRPVVPRDRQFVFLNIRHDGPDANFPPATSFRLLVDDQRYRGASEVGDGVDIRLVSYFNDFVHVSPSTDDERATVAVEVPLQVAPDRVAVEWVGSSPPYSRLRATACRTFAAR